MKKKAIIITAIGLAVAICVGIIIFAVLGNNSREIAKNLNLGNKYLAEYNYEEAVAAFNKVLEIDPMNVEAYLGLVEAYIELNDFETALEWAEKGYEATGSEELKKKIEMLESGNVVDARNRVHCAYYYGEEGEFLGSIRYTYDKDRTDVVSRYSPDGEEAYSIKCEYDEEGRNILGVHSFSLPQLVIKYSENSFDENGRISTSKVYNEDGSWSSTCTYEYDENGRIKRSEEDLNNNNVITYLYTYDEEGNKARMDQICKFKHDGHETHTYYLYSYDSNGNMIEQETYDEKGLMSQYTYTYDEDGNMVSSIRYDAEGNVTNSTYYE